MGKIATVLCLVLSFFGNAQDIMVQYQLEMRTKKGDTARQKEMFILAIDTEHQKSIFENAEVFNRRNIEKPTFFTEFGIDQHLYHKIYKDFPDYKLEDFQSVSGYFYHKNFIFPIENWKLQTEQKEIGGYVCQKALLLYEGRAWEAWYTLDISIFDGPYKFYGLPGLILEIYSKDGDYQFTMKSLTKGQFSWTLPKSIKVDNDALDDLKRTLIKDPSYKKRQSIQNSDYSTTISFNGKRLEFDKKYYDQVNQEYWEWLKNHNNPLEKTEIWVK